jgi:L-ascorbate metabolism protein UlaG (beta-lactamase superfamily)
MNGCSARQPARRWQLIRRLRRVWITRYTHSCVRLEMDGAVLVIDPGTWSEAHALPGCDAVLVTHEHNDHVDVLRLAGPGVPVTALGGRHAAVYGDDPGCRNLGYLVGGRVYHPGDALHVPDQPVETLLVPLHASWLKTAEAISFVQAIQPELAYGIHDAQLSERGLASVNGWLAEKAGPCYRWLPPTGRGSMRG